MKIKIGSEGLTLPELSQPHRIIQHSLGRNYAISDEIVRLYQKGLSIRDIRKQTGKAISTIRGILVRKGIELRPKISIPASSSWKSVGKRNIRPPYGFCYFQGQVVPDQHEYENLLLIHRLWQESVNPNAIADKLNAKKIRPRSAATWNRNSVVNILERFKSKTIVIKGETYELR